MRMVADLGDLGLRPGGNLALGAHGWIQNDVSPCEVAGVGRPCQRLAAGDPLRADRDHDASEAALFRHIITGVCDTDYRRSLKLRR